MFYKQRVNPTVPSPQAARECIAEKLGEISQGLAANGGGEGLSALLIGLINLILAALRSITWQVGQMPSAARAEPNPILATPRQASGTQLRAETTSSVRSRPVPRKSKRQQGNPRFRSGVRSPEPGDRALRDPPPRRSQAPVRASRRVVRATAPPGTAKFSSKPQPLAHAQFVTIEQR
jgi:hypothetical protein